MKVSYFFKKSSLKSLTASSVFKEASFGFSQIAAVFAHKTQISRKTRGSRQKITADSKFSGNFGLRDIPGR